MRIRRRSATDAGASRPWTAIRLDRTEADHRAERVDRLHRLTLPGSPGSVSGVRVPGPAPPWQHRGPPRHHAVHRTMSSVTTGPVGRSARYCSYLAARWSAAASKSSPAPRMRPGSCPRAPRVLVPVLGPVVDHERGGGNSLRLRGPRQWRRRVRLPLDRGVQRVAVGCEAARHHVRAAVGGGGRERRHPGRVGPVAASPPCPSPHATTEPARRRGARAYSPAGRERGSDRALTDGRNVSTADDAAASRGRLRS